MSAGDERAFAYLHGFASSPLATKGKQLARRFGALNLELRRPDLNAPSFEQLRVSAMLDQLDALDAQLQGRSSGAAPRWAFVGSSMGAWAGALWAAQRPERVAACVWLAPGFSLATRWPALMGPEAFARWECEGSLMLPDGAGVARPVHFDLVLDARKLDPAPAPVAPTLIVHGRKDDVVPIEISRSYVEAHGEGDVPLRLIELDDDHRLHASVDTIWSAIRSHFELP